MKTDLHRCQKALILEKPAKGKYKHYMSFYANHAYKTHFQLFGVLF